MYGALRFEVSGDEVRMEQVVPERSAGVEPSPADGRLAVTIDRLNCDPAVTNACQVRNAPQRTRRLYHVGLNGSSLRLDGLGDYVDMAGWSPDGSVLAVYAAEPPAPAGRALYLVPVDGGTATPLNRAIINRSQIAWSADGGRLAYLVDGDVIIFDRRVGQERRLTQGAGYDRAFLRWSDDGSAVLLSHQGTLVAIDATSGATLISWRSPHPLSDIALAPGGRYLAISEWPGAMDGRSEPCEGPVWRNRTLLHDRASGESRLLRDCDDPYTTRVQWLPDGRHLLLLGPRPNRYEGVEWRASLVDVEGGTSVELTDGLEHHAGTAVSPDGGRLLVTGHALRIYTAEGRLLREVAVPDELDVASAVWSPDGRSIVYIVGPRGFFRL